MRLLLAVLVLALAGNAWSQLFTDTFNGRTLDSSKWNVLLPFAESVASLSSGAVISKNRGGIITASDFLSPYEISGTFMNNNARSVFIVTLRSDGSSDTDIYRGLRGLSVSFWADDAFPNNRIGISTSQGTGALWETNFALPSGSPIFYRIFDYGSRISLEVNDTFITEFSTSYALGGKIGLSSRENASINLWGSGDVSIMDFQVIPEPSSLSLLLAGGAVLAAARRRRLV